MPGFGRGRRWTARVAGILAVSPLLAFAAWTTADGHQAPASRPGTHVLRIGPGATLTRFSVSEPAGVIRLLRVTVPHGTRAKLTGVISGVAGVEISTPHSSIPSETCEQHGAVDICDQAEEACPMPPATWRFTFRKLAGPAGRVRVQFVVGPPPARSAIGGRGRRRDAARPLVGPRIRVPSGAVDVVASDNALWVAGFGAVSRLDPTSGRVAGRIRTPGTGDDSRIAAGAGSVWITAGGGVVYRIDPSTNGVVATIQLGGSLQGIAFGADRVWVTRPAANGIGRPIPLSAIQPIALTTSGGAVWVADYNRDTVTRIAPVLAR